MTWHKKCHQKCKETEATEDVSAESSENDLNMSGENTLSDGGTKIVGKEKEKDLMPICITFELLKTAAFAEQEDL